jgi:hypothetical protein|tara:strand:- start:4872 stop:4979 length:108 start_codon:yes stop_codon:yes gene_type:complete
MVAAVTEEVIFSKGNRLAVAVKDRKNSELLVHTIF